MAMRNIGGRRMHVILPAAQISQLQRLSNATGLTVAEHVRRAIDVYFRAMNEQARKQEKN